MKGSALLILYLLRVCCCASVARYARTLSIHFAHLAHCAHGSAFGLFIAGPDQAAMANWLWAALTLVLMVVSLVEVACVTCKLVQEFKANWPVFRQRLVRLRRRLHRRP